MVYPINAQCKDNNYSVYLLKDFYFSHSLDISFEGKSLSLAATSCASTHSSGGTPQRPVSSKPVNGFSIFRTGNSRRKRDFRSGLWPLSSTPPHYPRPTAPEGSRHKSREAQLLRVPLAGTASGLTLIHITEPTTPY